MKIPVIRVFHKCDKLKGKKEYLDSNKAKHMLKASLTISKTRLKDRIFLLDLNTTLNKIFKEELYFINKSINIGISNKLHRSKNGSTLLIRLFKKISRIISYHKHKLEISRNLVIENKNSNKIKATYNKKTQYSFLKVLISKKFTSLVIIFLILIVFGYDYYNIKNNLESSSNKRLAKLQNEYDLNWCPSELPALKEKCLELENLINELKSRKITFTSIVISWVLEIFKSININFTGKIIGLLFGIFVFIIYIIIRCSNFNLSN